MHLEIRQATPDDADLLARVEIASWRAAYAGLMPAEYLAGLSRADKATAWRQNLLKHGPNGRKRVLVVDINQLIAGFVRVGVEGGEPPMGVVYLLYLMPQHQRRGLGSAFMDAAMMDLRELGAREAILWVLRDNHPARAFYEKHGWQPDGRTSTDNYGGVTLEALCYRRTVPEATP